MFPCIPNWSQAKVAEVCHDFELPSPCCIIALNHTASYFNFSLKGRCVSAGKINVCQYVSGGRQSLWAVKNLLTNVLPNFSLKWPFINYIMPCWVRQDGQCFTRCWFPPGKWSCYLRLVAGWRLRAPHLMIFGDAKSAEKMRCNQMQIRGAPWEHHLFGSFGFRQQGSQTLSYFFLSPPVHAAWSLLIRAWIEGFRRLCEVSFKTLC